MKNSKIKELEQEMEEIIPEFTDEQLIERWRQRNEYSEYINKMLEKEVFKRGIPVHENPTLYDYKAVDNKILIDREFYNYESGSVLEGLLKLITFIFFIISFGAIIYIIVKKGDIEIEKYNEYKELIYIFGFFVIAGLIAVITNTMFKILKILRKNHNLMLYKLKKERF